MEIIESFIFLMDNPSFVVKVYLNNVFSIVSVISRIFSNQSLLNADAHWNLKEMRPVKSMIFVAIFDMINEDL